MMKITPTIKSQPDKRVQGSAPGSADLVSPPPDCQLCPRLFSFLEAQRAKEPDWHNKPVLSFGELDARLLIVGLAPGMRGANRTGRPFTGDFAGDLLYSTLISFGFAAGTYRADPGDGLQLCDAMLTNAVRCLPPENKPIGAEIRSCNRFLAASMANMPNLKVIVSLGRIAHDAVLMACQARRSAHVFGHNSVHQLGDYRMIDSYHCSRYNTNTRRLTEPMFRQVFDQARKILETGA